MPGDYLLRFRFFRLFAFITVRHRTWHLFRRPKVKNFIVIVFLQLHSIMFNNTFIFCKIKRLEQLSRLHDAEQDAEREVKNIPVTIPVSCHWSAASVCHICLAFSYKVMGLGLGVCGCPNLTISGHERGSA